MKLELDENQIACLEEYSDITGTSVDECAREALDDWIRAVAAAAISHFEKPAGSGTILMFPSSKLVH